MYPLVSMILISHQMTHLLVLMMCLGMKGHRTLNTAKAASGSGSGEAGQALGEGRSIPEAGQPPARWSTAGAVVIDDAVAAVSYSNSVVDEALVHRLA